MPLVTIQGPPGFSGQKTKVAAAGRWFAGNLLRWRQGDLEKMPGWLRLFPDPFLGFIRRMHAWLDLSDHRQLLVGTDSGLQIAHEQTVYTVDTDTILADPRQETWHLDNLGENGFALKTGGPLQIYKPAQGGGVVPDDPPTVSVVTEAPERSNIMISAMPQAQLILGGTMSVADPDTG